MYMRLLAILCLSIALVSCNRDPNANKKRYLDRGVVYFDKGQYKPASIMFRRALSVDQKYGEAWYRLALTSLKQGQVANSVPALRRAMELLPKGTKEYNETSLNLAEILLLAAQQSDQGNRNQQLTQDVDQIATGFLQRDPNSFEGHKLKSDLLFARAVGEYKRNEIVNSKKSMEDTIAGYRKTLELRPGESAVMLSLARTLSLYGEPGEAEQLYRGVIDKGKSGNSGYIELYRLYVQQRKVAEAEAVLKKAIAANPKDYSFKTLLAAHYFSNSNKPEGMKMLDQLKGNYKDFPNAFFTAGDFYLRLNDGPTAIKQYEEGQSKDSARKLDYQKRIIEVLIHDGKTAQAYEKNLEILKANPKDPEARGLKASFLLDKGDINQAINELQAVVTARPDNFVARFHLGRAHFAKGEYEQARQQFEKAIELRPDYLPPRLALSQVALARGDNDTALKYAEQGLRLNPQSGAARLLQSAALMRLQKFTESRSTLDQLLAANPKQPDTLLEIGVLDLMEKKYQAAADMFQKAYEADPTNSRGLLGGTEALLLLRQPEQAVNRIREESQKYPNRLDLKRDLGDVELRTGQFAAAVKEYQDLLSHYKDNPRQEGEIWARIAATYYDLKDTPKAIDAYKKSKELIPDNVTVLNNLAILLDNSGQHAEARKVYEQSIQRDPNNPEALNNLAYLMAETGGNLDEALTLATRAKQKLPTMSEVSDTIGWIYLKKNLSDNAADIFKDLVGKVPDNSTYRYHYAMALVQKGDKANATLQCQAALKNKPNKEEEGRIRDLMNRI
jgi:tetratricopeptide (TPR) repeat protein